MTFGEMGGPLIPRRFISSLRNYFGRGEIRKCICVYKIGCYFGSQTMLEVLMGPLISCSCDWCELVVMEDPLGFLESLFLFKYYPSSFHSVLFSAIWGDASSVVDLGITGCFGHYHKTPSSQEGPAGSDHFPVCIPYLINLFLK